MNAPIPQPLLSIIIPLYNAAPFIEEAVESIYRQELARLGGATEIIIVNDGSTDDSADIVRRLMSVHPEIILIEQDNGGISAAHNTGIRRARGELIGFLHADDAYADGALAFLVGELHALRRQYGDLVMVRGHLRFWKLSAAGDWYLESEPAARAQVTPALHTRATVDAVGFFDEDLVGHEDADWLMRAQEQGIVMPLLERVVLHYRKHDDCITLQKAEEVHEARRLMLKKCIERKHAQRLAAKSGETAH